MGGERSGQIIIGGTVFPATEEECEMIWAEQMKRREGWVAMDESTKMTPEVWAALEKRYRGSV